MNRGKTIIAQRERHGRSGLLPMAVLSALALRPLALRPLAFLGLAAAAAFSGCGSPEAEFKMNRVFIGKHFQEALAGEAAEDADEAREIRQGRQRQLETVNATLVAMFGTPDDPFPASEEEDIGLGPVVDPSLLAMAAGPVGRDPNGVARGLYRQHCVHCHGVTGDGAGPTAAFLNPYPRDFRMGKFKFKRTPLGQKPTDKDLRDTLVNGIPGTAMPSFKALLAEDEIDALINYVKYLAIRGEVERKLVLELTYLDPSEELETSKDLLVDTFLADVVAKWQQAKEFATPVPPRPEWNSQEHVAAIARGKELFQGKEANCFSCHGVTGLGDGQTGDYDDWTKDFADWSNILDPEEKAERMETYVELGGLPPRNIKPRNLRQGVYRGGRRPIDLYWRIKNGIEGTPMPAAGMQQTPGGPGLSEDDLWDLIAYVQHMPQETISQPPEAVLENLRENP